MLYFVLQFVYLTYMFGYFFFRILVALFAVLPFKVIYAIADFISWLLYGVVKYRRKVVESQLRKSFPDLDDESLRSITKASYTNLADIIVEAIKGFTMSESAFRKRYIFTNPELLDQYASGEKNILLAAAHYGNWEWAVISLPLWFQYPALGFYKPISNQYLEKYARKVRSRLGFMPIPIGQTSEYINKYKDQAAILLFITDQNNNSKKAHWVNFLGQETACPYGADKYARQLQDPVLYMHFERVKRGYYEIDLSVITDGNETLSEGIVTKRFMEILEQKLVKKPKNWLWSHKRWKRERSPEDRLIV